MLRYAEHVSGDMYKVKQFIELDEESECSETMTKESSAEKDKLGFLLSESEEIKPQSPVDRHVE